MVEQSNGAKMSANLIIVFMYLSIVDSLELRPELLQTQSQK